MSHKPLSIVLVAGVALAAAAGAIWYQGRHRAAAPGTPAHVYSCPMHPQIVRDAPGDCPVCGMKLQPRTSGQAAATPGVTTPRRILYYRHPMNPSVRSERPAKDDMGMDYVPVYDDETGAAVPVPGRAAVVVPIERMAALGIRSEPVGRGAGGSTLRTVGRVAVDERRREVVHAKYEGFVERLLVDFTGQEVRKGQPLLSIYSPELVAAQQEYLVAWRAQERLGASSVPGVAAGGRDLVEAARQRLRYYDVGPAEIAALESSGTPRRTVTVLSPVSGVVVEKAALAGMRVSPTDRLYEIADLSRAWVLAEVHEKDLRSVRLGMPVRVELAAQPAQGWRGTVSFVSPMVKADTRTAEVRLEVTNRQGLLKPDMFVDVYLERETQDALTVPEGALIFTGERTLVFLDRGEGRLEPREVSVGARAGAAYEVLGGLVEGDRVVVGAGFLLDSESSLRAAISAAGGQ